MESSFANQTVLITGATRGIGKLLAENFERLEAATLILTGTNRNQIDDLNATAEKNGGHCRYFCVDFANKKSTADFLDCLKEFKKIDVLVNNAGINKIDPIDQTDPADWDRLMEVNLKAPYLLIRELAPLMKRNGYGRIVNIASIFGLISREKRSLYTMSKYGLRGLTVTSAIELARHGILVNTVSPGFVDTRLTRNILSDEEISELEKQIPAGRLAKPEEIVNVVLFFAGPQNTYVTGQNIIADGGYANV